MTSSGMLRRQILLMRRTVRAVAHEPRVGREAGRLIATCGRSTMRLRLPWLPFRLIDELSEVVGSGTTVFEYGGGGSTLWFLDRGASVVTVEHHEGWAEQLRARVNSTNWILLERPLGGDAQGYVGSIKSFDDESFDVVLVDGRERARCVMAAMPKVRRGGYLIVDDVDRDRYAAALARLQWPRHDVVGFAPAKPSLAYSAVFRRPHTHD